MNRVIFFSFVLFLSPYVWYIENACLRQSEVIKVFQLCNMIYISRIHMLEHFQNGGCLRTTVPERKFVTKIPVRYHDPRWRRQQPVRMFTPRFLLFRIVFHMFDAGYRAIVSYCFYVIPESVIEFDKTAVNWWTKNTKDLGNSSVRSW